MWYKEVHHLLKKEIAIEWRNKLSFSSMLLFVASTVFVCSLSFRKIIDPITWNALYWVITLFAAMNVAARSFLQESRGSLLYYHSIASPQAIILAKTLFNLLLMFAMSGLTLLLYSWFLGTLVQSQWQFLIAQLLSISSLSAVLSMISAIAGKAGQNTSMMTILSIPVLVPTLLTALKCSKNAVDGLDIVVNTKYFVALGSLGLITMALSLILFPFLWKE